MEENKNSKKSFSWLQKNKEDKNVKWSDKKSKVFYLDDFQTECDGHATETLDVKEGNDNPNETFNAFDTANDEGEKSDKKSIDEIQYMKILKDGSTRLIYDIGPFSEETMRKVVSRAHAMNIPICLSKQKSFERATLSNSDIQKRDKIIQELNEVYKKISEFADKNGNHAKQFHALSAQRKTLGEELNALMNKRVVFEFHLFINASRSDFIDIVRECAYPQDIAIRTMHEQFQHEIQNHDELIPVVVQKPTVCDLQRNGSFGDLSMEYFVGEDYMEAYITPQHYHSFRNMVECPMDHVAVKMKAIDSICIRFSAKQMIDYVLRLALAKPIPDEVYLNYIHTDEETYHNLDFSRNIDSTNNGIYEWKMNADFDKLQKIEQCLHDAGHKMSYRIYLEPIDFRKKENMKKLKMILRSDVQINPTQNK